jgi:multiple sugar transport system substrate-binding protein
MAGCAMGSPEVSNQRPPMVNETANSVSKPIELRAIWWGSQDRHERTFKAWELYSSKNPSIKITSEYSGWDAYWEQVAIKVAGGDAPDLIQMDYAYLNEYAGRGALLDLSPFLGNVLDLSTMDQRLIDSGTVAGKLYSVCLGSNSMAMHVNKTLLDRAGLQAPSTEWTWSDFEEMGRQFKAQLGGEGIYFSTDQVGDMNTLLYWLRPQGKGLYSGTAFAFNESDLIDYFKYWEGLRNQGIAPPGEVTAAHGGNMPPLDQSLWVKQRTPLQWGWANEYERYATIIKDEVVATSYPRAGTGLDGHYPKCSQFFSVSSRSKYPTEAVALISWMIRDQEAAKILAANRGVPVTGPAREALLAAGLSKYDQITFKVTDEISKFAGPTPPPEPKGHPDIVKLFVRTAEEMQFNRKTPEAAAKGFMAEGIQILQRANQ